MFDCQECVLLLNAIEGGVAMAVANLRLQLGLPDLICTYVASNCIVLHFIFTGGCGKLQ